MEPDDTKMFFGLIGLPHDVDLHQDLATTGLSSPTFLQDFSSELVPRGFLSAFLNNGKLSPEEKEANIIFLV